MLLFASNWFINKNDKLLTSHQHFENRFRDRTSRHTTGSTGLKNQSHIIYAVLQILNMLGS